jgi:hypothetical protein
MLKWTVADLAAGFLAQMHAIEFDWRAQPAERKARRVAILKQVSE